MPQVGAKDMTAVETIGNRAARPIADQRGRHRRHSGYLNEPDQKNIMNACGDKAYHDKG